MSGQNINEVSRLKVIINNAKPLLYQTQDIIYFFKNKNFEYVDCNQQLVNFSRLSNEKNIIGLTDESLPWGEDTKFYRKLDKQILLGKEKNIFLDVRVASGERRFAHQKKSPIRDEFGNVLGIMVGMQETTPSSSDALVSIKQRDEEIIFHSNKLPIQYLLGVYEEYGLTLRESECLFYTLRGMNAKMIAKYLHKSPRTIERFISNLKEKLGCYHKSDLIERVYKDGVMNIMPPSINFQFLQNYIEGR